jgi:(2Fe-2S) ferredoxin
MANDQVCCWGWHEERSPLPGKAPAGNLSEIISKGRSLPWFFPDNQDMQWGRCGGRWYWEKKRHWPKKSKQGCVLLLSPLSLKWAALRFSFCNTMPQEIFPTSSQEPAGDRQILVCCDPCCAARGSALVLDAFQQMSLPPDITVQPSPCQGQCHLGVTVRLLPEEIWYCRVTPADVPAICEALPKNTPVVSKLNPRIHPQTLS